MADYSAEQLLTAQLADMGVFVSDETVSQLVWLGQELLRWNQRINLTAIKSIEEVIEKHLVDSLSVLPLLVGNERLLDVGSGGGFPGLPLKIALSGLSLVTVDAVAKKINFQRHVARRLALINCEPLHVRVEDVPHSKGCENGFDVVISRAFSSLRDFIQFAQPCTRQGGRIIAMKGPEGLGELHDVADLLARFELEHQETVRLFLPKSKAERLLIVFKKS